MSDQDFFFDDDEPKASKASVKPAKKAPTKPSGKAANAMTPSVGGIELSWTITALIGVVSLLLGVIVGYAIPKGTEIATPTTNTTTQQTAPQLSAEQLSSGKLPAGHPDISGMSGSSGTTGSTDTSASK